MQNRQETGALGERLARQYLEQCGYIILEVNWSSLYGEIDIVAKHRDVLVFVEVKTRRDSNTESALAGITAAKRERLLSAVHFYLHEHALDSEIAWRIDVIAIALDSRRAPQIDHVEDAFDW